MTSMSYSVAPNNKLSESTLKECGPFSKGLQARIACTDGLLMRAPGTKTGNGKETQASVAVESVEAAEEAGLRYISDDRPGYTRKANGEHFEYLDTEGKRIRDEQRVLRIKRLAIPPAPPNV